MNVTGALILFAVLALLYILIVEIFTILFRLTGLTYEKARFQVISMLTNCGFTTQTSESVVSSVIRRRLTKITIIFGYLFTVVIMSSIVNVFLSLSHSEVQDMWTSGIVIACLIGLVLMFNRSNTAKKLIDLAIAKVGRRIMFGKHKNTIVVLDYYGDNVMAEVNLDVLPTDLQDVTLKDSGLKEVYKVQLILIKRKGQTKSILTGEEMLQQDDLVVVFGNYNNIRKLFHA